MRSFAFACSLALVVSLLGGCDDDPPATFDAGPRRDAGGDAMDGGGVVVLPDGAVLLPDGAILDRDGGFMRPDGNFMEDDAGRLPDAGPPPCPNDDLGMATGEEVATGNLDGQGNQFRPSCAEIMNGEDAVYRWTAPSTAEWLFDTHGSVADTVLAIHSGDACPGSEIACNDDADEAVQSAVRVSLNGGDSVLIVIDEYVITERGGFVLNIHPDVPSTETDCGNGTDDDRDGQADCGDRDCAGASGC